MARPHGRNPGDPSDPASAARQDFSTTFRGFDPVEVRNALGELAAALDDAERRERLARVRAETAERKLREVDDLDADELTMRAGRRTVAVLEAARTTADEIEAEARALAESLRADADAEARRVREGAKDDRRRLLRETTEAHTVATQRGDELVSQARQRAKHDLEQARDHADNIVGEARAVRDRIALDLIRRRREAQRHFEELRTLREEFEGRLDEVERLLADGRVTLSRVFEPSAGDGEAADIDLDDDHAFSAEWRQRFFPNEVARPVPEPELAPTEGAVANSSSEAGVVAPANEVSGEAAVAGDGGAKVFSLADARTREANRRGDREATGSRYDHPALGPDGPPEANDGEDSAPEQVHEGDPASLDDLPEVADHPGTRAETSGDADELSVEASDLATDLAPRDFSDRGPAAADAPSDTGEGDSSTVAPAPVGHPAFDAAPAAPDLSGHPAFAAASDDVTDDGGGADLELASSAEDVDVAGADGVGGDADADGDEVVALASATLDLRTEPIDLDTPLANEVPASEVSSDTDTSADELLADHVSTSSDSDSDHVSTSSDSDSDSDSDSGSSAPVAPVAFDTEGGGGDAPETPRYPHAGGETHLVAGDVVGTSQPLDDGALDLTASAAQAGAGPASVDDVDNLFAQLRATVVAVEDDDLAPATSLEPTSADVVAFVAEQDRALDEFPRRLHRRIKRLLTQDEKRVLDALRRTSGSLPEALEASDDAGAVFRSEPLVELISALRAGAESVGEDADVPREVIHEVCDEFLTELVVPLHRLVATAVEASGSARDHAIDSVRECFRQTKLNRSREMIDHWLAAAYARGAYEAIAPGTPVQWVSIDLAVCGAECARNAGTLDLTKGDAFPNGLVRPPVHPRCRCVVVPVD